MKFTLRKFDFPGSLKSTRENFQPAVTDNERSEADAGLAGASQDTSNTCIRWTLSAKLLSPISSASTFKPSVFHVKRRRALGIIGSLPGGSYAKEKPVRETDNEVFCLVVSEYV